MRSIQLGLLISALLFLSPLLVMPVGASGTGSYASPGYIEPAPDTLLVEIRAEPIPRFVNVTLDKNIGEIEAHFLSWVDYNNDGNLDILVNGSRLLKNEGPAANYTFIDVTEQVGIQGGAQGVWGDYNNDGYIDLYVTGGVEYLWKNRGPAYGYSFTDVTAQAGGLRDGNKPSASAAWADYDRDGHLDLFVGSGEIWNETDPGERKYFKDHLWHNDGDGTFTEVLFESGINQTDRETYSRGASWVDYNMDNLPDLYVSNYRQQPNNLYRNEGPNATGVWKFTDVGEQVGVADGDKDPPLTIVPNNPDPFNRPGHSLGSCWGDMDNDGDQDLWVSNLNHKDASRVSDDSLLYRNDGQIDRQGNYQFTNIRGEAGIPVKLPAGIEGDETIVGCAWGDMDNDGWLDLYLPQIYDINSSFSYIYHNDGDADFDGVWDGTFTEVAEITNIKVWDTYAGAWGDYNNDGFLDLLTGGKGEPETTDAINEIHIYENKRNENNWLKFDTVGVKSNNAGIGAKVTIDAIINQTTYTMVRFVEGGTGSHSSQNQLPLHFGIGEATKANSVSIRWPSGLTESFSTMERNITKLLIEPSPDLVVQSVTFSNNMPLKGETVELMATLGNVHSKSSVISEVRFYLGNPLSGGKYLGTESGGIISPGDSYEVPFSWSIMDNEGALDIWVWIFTSSPPEKDETNNMNNATLFVRASNPPPVADLSVDRTEALPDDVISFDASGSSDDIWVDAYRFDFGDGIVTNWGPNPLINHVYASPGLYNATVTVKDTDGAENTDYFEILILIPPNQLPAATIETLSRNPTKEGKPVTFTGSGTDGDGAVVGYQWTSSLNGFLSDQSTFTITTLTQGNHVIDFMVQDDHGDWSIADTVSINVGPPNQIPTAAIPVVSPGLIQYGEYVDFNSYGTDVDGSITKYEWISNISGLLSHQSKFSSWEMEEGEHDISFRVCDDEGDWSLPKNVHLTVLPPNQPPVALIESISPNPAFRGEKITFRGTATDDGTIQDYIWRSSIDGVMSNSKEFSISGLSEGYHVISLTARDNDGALSEAVIEGLRIEKKNEVPTAVIQTIQPSTVVREGTSVRFSGFGVDDGRIVETVWTSSRDGELGRGYVVEKVLSIGEHTITLRVKDDRGEWSVDAVESVTVKPNSLPLISISTPRTGSEFTENTTVYFDASNSSDPDNDFLVYKWISSIDGELASSSSFAIKPRLGFHLITLTITDPYGGTVNTTLTIFVSSVDSTVIPVVPPEQVELDKAQGLINTMSRPEDYLLSPAAILVVTLLLLVVVLTFVARSSKPRL